MFKCSYEKLKTYKTCPQRYKFSYLDLLGEKFKKPKAEFTMGQHIHTTLRALLANIPKTEQNPKIAKDLLRKYWRTNRTGFKDRANEKSYGESALQMIDAFFNTNLIHNPHALERYVKLTIGRDIEITGRVDRIDVDSAGAAHIIDYKTNNYSPEWVDFSQLMIYAYLVLNSLKLPVVSASFWYLAQNQFVTIFPRTSELDTVQEEIIFTAKRIMKDDKFLPQESHACSWCEYASICPLKKLST
jgi:putative RecB family exonuclease